MCVGGGGYAGRVPGVTWCAARTVLLSVGPGAAQQERGREVSSWRGAATRSQLVGAVAGAGPVPRARRAGGTGDGRLRYCGTLAQPRSPSGPRSPSPGGRPGDRCCERGGRASAAQSLRLPAGVTATTANQRGPRGLGCEVRARGAERGSGGGEECRSCTPPPPGWPVRWGAQPTLVPLPRERVFV